MPLQAAADLPTTLYAEVAGLGADGRGRDVARLALLRPGDGLTEDAVLEIAHRFILSGARLADRSGKVIGEVTETAVAPPGGLNWYGLAVPEGTWVAAIRVASEGIAHSLKSARQVVLHPMVEQEPTKRGDDVDERTLSKVLQAALQPLLDAAARAEIRLKRLETALTADPFGDAVRGRGDAGVRELERRKRLLQRVDPVGAAISERRPPLVSSRPTPDELGRRRDPDEAPLNPSDPFADAVTRPRPQRRRPAGASFPVKR